MASAFGLRLRRLREAKKLTLQQVADAVGCTKAYIWELEMKDGQRPSAERVFLLAKTFGVTVEDLMAVADAGSSILPLWGQDAASVRAPPTVGGFAGGPPPFL